MAPAVRYSRFHLILFTLFILFSSLSASEHTLDSSKNDLSLPQLHPEDNSFHVKHSRHHSHRQSHHSHSHHHPLIRREDFTCGPGKPCSNGACCGASGNCGFGPTYCGNGCTSNCDATAPCGKYHKVPGTTCPLNTCCSEWGFCGTSADFCNAKCQSNCEPHPKPKASGGQVLDKVVGYYESWSARLSCHKMAPTDLPLDALTHLNYAFAYIDPKTLSLTTMDAQTPESLFKEVADVKKYNSRLEVWISVGGWTFSDNGTVTQPLFGDIARSAGKRREFANNVLKFLNQYGYDGIDIDWEYPGAPDRGGKEDDTKNYVELLKQLRATFDASGRKLGITFTAPSSYWYLRWFDLPGMLKYSDWINVMTYDLHGTWDSTNPIGNIVQGHTNLTEIETALELFWRVNIPPEKVFMGFGFYGRSFQLADPSCSTPGCLFKGGAAKGPCSDTSGILMYYEIMNLLKQNPSLKPVYDRNAGVKYLVYNKDQWVSYDDAQTMKQKREWANKIGLGGSLIWASDADDDKFTAHTGLHGGKTFQHVNVQAMANKQLSKDSLAVTENLVAQNGQDCEPLDECKKDDGSEGTCGSKPGSVLRGWEKGKCGSGKQHPICCPAKTAPKEGACRWRGHVSDCNGQCHPGESLVMRSSWGGSPTESKGNTKKCGRGVKAFCCDAGAWKTITDQCYWTDCGKQCPIDRVDVAQRNMHAEWGCISKDDPNAHYCCRKPAILKQCTWRTGAAFDCAEAKCEKGEVQIDTYPSGNGKFQCAWGRNQVLCCKAEAPPPPKELTCPKDLCNVSPEDCPDAEETDDDSLTRRDAGLINSDSNLTALEGDDDDDDDDDDDMTTLEGRGTGLLSFELGPKSNRITRSRRMNWPSAGRLFSTQYRRRTVRPILFRMRANNCADTTVNTDSINPNSSNPIPTTTRPSGKTRSTADTEHAIDRQVFQLILEWMSLGYMIHPITQAAIAFSNGALDPSTMDRTMFANTLPASVGGMGSSSRAIREPIARMSHHLGTTTNPSSLLATEVQVNQMKGRIMGFDSPMADNVFTPLMQRAATGLDIVAQERIMLTFRNVIGTFEYLQTPEVVAARADVRDGILQEFDRVAALDPGMYHAPAYFRTALYRHNRWVEDFAQEWMTDHIQAFENQIILAQPPNAAQLLADLKDMKGKIKDMVIKD